MGWQCCPKCRGPMYYESGYEWAWICLMCGKRVYVGGVLEAQPIPEGTSAVTRPLLPVFRPSQVGDRV